MTPPFDEATAYHEAGHAVVALALGRPIHRVSVLPDGQYLGLCRFGKGVFRPSEDWLEREILIALGGIAAEARQTGHYAWDGAARDQQYVRRLAEQRAGERQAERLEDVAAEFVQRGVISGRTARHLFDRGCNGC